MNELDNQRSDKHPEKMLSEKKKIQLKEPDDFLKVSKHLQE